MLPGGEGKGSTTTITLTALNIKVSNFSYTVCILASALGGSTNLQAQWQLIQ